METSSIIFNFFLIFVLTGILLTWSYFLIFMIYSIKKSPNLTIQTRKSEKHPKVTVILPARNEKNYIDKCITSIIKQTYPNFEIILVNDESDDGTLDVMTLYAKSHPNMTVISTPRRPEEWIGKNWACYNGYLKASGELLLFTDADSFHSEKTMEMAVNYSISHNLDAITIMPRLLCYDILTKITLPLLTIFMHTRFSPLKVNDRKSKIAYFFGSYYLISKKVYEEIGTHQSVRHELVEDGALGRKVKDGNYKMMMLRGENYVNAVWARNSVELIHAIDRLVVPLFKENKIKTVMLSVALFFLFLFPFIIFPHSIILYVTNSSNIFLAISVISIAIISIILYINTILSEKTLFLSKIYSFGAPIGAIIIIFGFIKGVIKGYTNGLVSWRDRKYSISSNQNPL